MKHLGSCIYYICAPLVGALVCGCGCGCGARSGGAVDGGTAAKRAAEYHFRTVEPPMQVTGEGRFAYMAEHYWDLFDFVDTLFIARVDTVEMVRAYAAYVANFVAPTDQRPIRELMKRASTSKPMLEYFSMLAQRVLHDPNSPLRSEELYIPALEAQLASPFYDEYELLAPAYDLEMANRNRLGHRANDFRYTLASGRSSNLYAIGADYVLLFINNPGCPMCAELREAIGESPLLGSLQRSGRLTVLSLYPDEDLDAWRAYAPSIPREWINAYDRGCAIRENDLYDLRAIPALYLLDRSKRVLVRDSASVGEIEAAIAACEGQPRL